MSFLEAPCLCVSKDIRCPHKNISNDLLNNWEKTEESIDEILSQYNRKDVKKFINMNPLVTAIPRHLEKSSSNLASASATLLPSLNDRTKIVKDVYSRDFKKLSEFVRNDNNNAMDNNNERPLSRPKTAPEIKHIRYHIPIDDGRKLPNIRQIQQKTQSDKSLNIIPSRPKSAISLPKSKSIHPTIYLPSHNDILSFDPISVWIDRDIEINKIQSISKDSEINRSNDLSIGLSNQTVNTISFFNQQRQYDKKRQIAYDRFGSSNDFLDIEKPIKTELNILAIVDIICKHNLPWQAIRCPKAQISIYEARLDISINIILQSKIEKIIFSFQNIENLIIQLDKNINQFINSKSINKLRINNDITYDNMFNSNNFIIQRKKFIFSLYINKNNNFQTEWFNSLTEYLTIYNKYMNDICPNDINIDSNYCNVYYNNDNNKYLLNKSFLLINEKLHKQQFIMNKINIKRQQEAFDWLCCLGHNTLLRHICDNLLVEKQIELDIEKDKLLEESKQLVEQYQQSYKQIQTGLDLFIVEIRAHCNDFLLREQVIYRTFLEYSTGLLSYHALQQNKYISIDPSVIANWDIKFIQTIYSSIYQSFLQSYDNLIDKHLENEITKQLDKLSNHWEETMKNIQSIINGRVNELDRQKSLYKRNISIYSNEQITIRRTKMNESINFLSTIYSFDETINSQVDNFLSSYFNSYDSQIIKSIDLYNNLTFQSENKMKQLVIDIEHICFSNDKNSSININNYISNYLSTYNEQIHEFISNNAINQDSFQKEIESNTFTTNYIQVLHNQLVNPLLECINNYNNKLNNHGDKYVDESNYHQIINIYDVNISNYVSNYTISLSMDINNYLSDLQKFLTSKKVYLPVEKLKNQLIEIEKLTYSKFLMIENSFFQYEKYVLMNLLNAYIVNQNQLDKYLSEIPNIISRNTLNSQSNVLTINIPDYPTSPSTNTPTISPTTWVSSNKKTLLSNNNSYNNLFCKFGDYPSINISTNQSNKSLINISNQPNNNITTSPQNTITGNSNTTSNTSNNSTSDDSTIKINDLKSSSILKLIKSNVIDNITNTTIHSFTIKFNNYIDKYLKNQKYKNIENLHLTVLLSIYLKTSEWFYSKFDLLVSLQPIMKAIDRFIENQINMQSDKNNSIRNIDNKTLNKMKDQLFETVKYSYIISLSLFLLIQIKTSNYMIKVIDINNYLTTNLSTYLSIIRTGLLISLTYSIQQYVTNYLTNYEAIHSKFIYQTLISSNYLTNQVLIHEINWIYEIFNISTESIHLINYPIKLKIVNQIVNTIQSINLNDIQTTYHSIHKYTYQEFKKEILSVLPTADIAVYMSIYQPIFQTDLSDNIFQSFSLSNNIIVFRLFIQIWREIALLILLYHSITFNDSNYINITTYLNNSSNHLPIYHIKETFNQIEAISPFSNITKVIETFTSITGVPISYLQLVSILSISYNIADVYLIDYKEIISKLRRYIYKDIKQLVDILENSHYIDNHIDNKVLNQIDWYIDEYNLSKYIKNNKISLEILRNFILPYRQTYVSNFLTHNTISLLYYTICKDYLINNISNQSIDHLTNSIDKPTVYNGDNDDHLLELNNYLKNYLSNSLTDNKLNGWINRNNIEKYKDSYMSNIINFNDIIDRKLDKASHNLSNAVWLDSYYNLLTFQEAIQFLKTNLIGNIDNNIISQSNRYLPNKKARIEINTINLIVQSYSLLINGKLFNKSFEVIDSSIVQTNDKKIDESVILFYQKSYDYISKLSNYLYNNIITTYVSNIYKQRVNRYINRKQNLKILFYQYENLKSLIINKYIDSYTSLLNIYVNSKNSISNYMNNKISIVSIDKRLIQKYLDTSNDYIVTYINKQNLVFEQLKRFIDLYSNDLSKQIIYRKQLYNNVISDFKTNYVSIYKSIYLSIYKYIYLCNHQLIINNNLFIFIVINKYINQFNIFISNLQTSYLSNNNFQLDSNFDIDSELKNKIDNKYIITKLYNHISGLIINENNQINTIINDYKIEYLNNKQINQNNYKDIKYQLSDCFNNKVKYLKNFNKKIQNLSNYILKQLHFDINKYIHSYIDRLYNMIASIDRYIYEVISYYNELVININTDISNYISSNIITNIISKYSLTMNHILTDGYIDNSIDIIIDSESNILESKIDSLLNKYIDVSIYLPTNYNSIFPTTTYTSNYISNCISNHTSAFESDLLNIQTNFISNWKIDSSNYLSNIIQIIELSNENENEIMNQFNYINREIDNELIENSDFSIASNMIENTESDSTTINDINQTNQLLINHRKIEIHRLCDPLIKLTTSITTNKRIDKQIINQQIGNATNNFLEYVYNFFNNQSINHTIQQASENFNYNQCSSISLEFINTEVEITLECLLVKIEIKLDSEMNSELLSKQFNDNVNNAINEFNRYFDDKIDSDIYSNIYSNNKSKFNSESYESIVKDSNSNNHEDELVNDIRLNSDRPINSVSNNISTDNRKLDITVDDSRSDDVDLDSDIDSKHSDDKPDINIDYNLGSNIDKDLDLKIEELESRLNKYQTIKIPFINQIIQQLLTNFLKIKQYHNLLNNILKNKEITFRNQLIQIQSGITKYKLLIQEKLLQQDYQINNNNLSKYMPVYRPLLQDRLIIIHNIEIISNRLAANTVVNCMNNLNSYDITTYRNYNVSIDDQSNRLTNQSSSNSHDKLHTIKYVNSLDSNNQISNTSATPIYKPIDISNNKLDYIYNNIYNKIVNELETASTISKSNSIHSDKVESLRKSSLGKLSASRTNSQNKSVTNRPQINTINDSNSYVKDNTNSENSDSKADKAGTSQKESELYSQILDNSPKSYKTSNSGLFDSQEGSQYGISNTSSNPGSYSSSSQSNGSQSDSNTSNSQSDSNASSSQSDSNSSNSQSDSNSNSNQSDSNSSNSQSDSQSITQSESQSITQSNDSKSISQSGSSSVYLTNNQDLNNVMERNDSVESIINNNGFDIQEQSVEGSLIESQYDSQYDDSQYEDSQTDSQYDSAQSFKENSLSDQNSNSSKDDNFNINYKPFFDFSEDDIANHINKQEIEMLTNYLFNNSNFTYEYSTKLAFQLLDRLNLHNTSMKAKHKFIPNQDSNIDIENLGLDRRLEMIALNAINEIKMKKLSSSSSFNDSQVLTNESSNNNLINQINDEDDYDYKEMNIITDFDANSLSEISSDYITTVDNDAASI